MIFKKCKLLTLWRISHNQLWVSALISVRAHYCPLISTKLPFRGNWLTSVSECKFWQFVRCFREKMGNHILTWEQCIGSQIRSDLPLFLSLAFAMFLMMRRRWKGKKKQFLKMELNIIRFVWVFLLLPFIFINVMLGNKRCSLFEKNRTQISASASLVWGTYFYRFPIRKQLIKKRPEIAFVF